MLFFVEDDFKAHDALLIDPAKRILGVRGVCGELTVRMNDYLAEETVVVHNLNRE